MWGLMALAALAATPPAATKAPPPTTTLSVDPFLKDVPGVTSTPTAPAGTKVDGVQVFQRSVRSDRSPSELREFFASAFEKAGFYIAPDQEVLTPQLGVQVTGLDTENLISYTALLQPSGGKGTTIVLAVANIGKRTSEGNPIGPVYPGGTAITSYNIETIKAMTYRVAATPAEIKNFYRDTLTSSGFKEVELNTYLKGHDQFTITVAPGISEQEVMVRLEPAGTSVGPAPKMPDTMPTELPKVTLPKGHP